MKNFIAIGNAITIAAAAATVSGQGVLQGSLFGIAAHSAATGEDLLINLTGIYELPKAGSQAWTVGQMVYWDNSAKVVTTAATDNTLIGVAVVPVTNAAANTVGTVRLNGAVA